MPRVRQCSGTGVPASAILQDDDDLPLREPRCLYRNFLESADENGPLVATSRFPGYYPLYAPRETATVFRS